MDAIHFKKEKKGTKLVWEGQHTEAVTPCRIRGRIKLQNNYNNGVPRLGQ